MEIGREGGKNVVSQFSFVIGEEKYCYKYMCFDIYNYNSWGLCSTSIFLKLPEYHSSSPTLKSIFANKTNQKSM